MKDTFIISSSGARYVVSFVSILEKNKRVLAP